MPLCTPIYGHNVCVCHAVCFIHCQLFQWWPLPVTQKWPPGWSIQPTSTSDPMVWKNMMCDLVVHDLEILLTNLMCSNDQSYLWRSLLWLGWVCLRASAAISVAPEICQFYFRLATVWHCFLTAVIPREAKIQIHYTVQNAKWYHKSDHYPISSHVLRVGYFVTKQVETNQNVGNCKCKISFCHHGANFCALY